MLPKKLLAIAFIQTLFRVFFVSWIAFSFLEYLWTGFVSNYFNVHWFLLAAIVFGIVLVYVEIEAEQILKS